MQILNNFSPLFYSLLPEKTFWNNYVWSPLYPSQNPCRTLCTCYLASYSCQKQGKYYVHKCILLFFHIKNSDTQWVVNFSSIDPIFEENSIKLEVFSDTMSVFKANEIFYKESSRIIKILFNQKVLFLGLCINKKLFNIIIHKRQNIFKRSCKFKSLS